MNVGGIVTRVENTTIFIFVTKMGWSVDIMRIYAVIDRKCAVFLELYATLCSPGRRV